MNNPKFEQAQPGETVRALLYEQAAILAEYNSNPKSTDFADVRANIKVMLDIYEALQRKE